MKKIVAMIMFFSLFQSIAWADIIHLRDGNVVEGNIRKVTDKKAYVDTELGTVSFSKDEIDWIEEVEKGTPAAQKKIMLPSTYIDELYGKGRTILERRKKVFKIKRNCTKVLKLIDSDRKKYLYHVAAISQLNKQIELDDAAIGNRKEKDMKDTNEQMRKGHVIQRNTHILKKRALLASVQGYYQKRFEFEQLFMKHLENLFQSQYVFNQAFLKVEESQIAEQDKYYFKELESEAQKFLHDFSLLGLTYTEEGGKIYVKGIVNDLVPVVFLVDLMSPTIAITEDLARTLDLSRQVPVGDTDLSHHDGVVKYGEPTILRSVEVDGFKERYISAVITGTLPVPHIDGILGRSFFYQCIVRPDPKDQQILVYKFLPKKE